MSESVDFRYFPNDTVHEVHNIWDVNSSPDFKYLKGEVEESDFDYYGFRKLWLNHAQVSLFAGRSYIPIHTLDDKQKFDEFIRGFKYLLEKRITSLTKELATASHQVLKDIADGENWKKFEEFSYNVDGVLEYWKMLESFNEYRSKGNGVIVISHSEIG